MVTDLDPMVGDDVGDDQPQDWRWVTEARTGRLVRAWPTARILLSKKDGTPPSLDVVTAKAAEIIDRCDGIPSEYHDVAQRWAEAKRQLERKRANEFVALIGAKDDTGKSLPKWAIDAKVAQATEVEADTFAYVDAERDVLDVMHKVLPELRALIQTISASQRDVDTTPRRSYR